MIGYCVHLLPHELHWTNRPALVIALSGTINFFDQDNLETFLNLKEHIKISKDFRRQELLNNGLQTGGNFFSQDLHSRIISINNTAYLSLYKYIFTLRELYCICRTKFRVVSSVGRASRLHREGHRFESFTAHHLGV